MNEDNMAFAGGGWIWAFLIIALIFNGNGFGFGGGNAAMAGYATMADVNAAINEAFACVLKLMEAVYIARCTTAKLLIMTIKQSTRIKLQSCGSL